MIKEFDKKLSLLCVFLCFAGTGYAQPWPRKPEFVLDNKKQMTDMNVSLYNVHSDYDFPYVIPTREDITEKLLRIHRHLEQSTMDKLIDVSTGEEVQDVTKLPQEFSFGEGDYRPYTYEWGVTYSGMLKAAAVTGEAAFLDYTDQRLALLAAMYPQVEKRKKSNTHYSSPINNLVAPHDLDACGALCAAVIRRQREGVGYDLSGFIRTSLDFISNKQFRLEDGTLARKRPYENTLWLDDLYMSIPALAEGYKLTGNEAFLNDAVQQILQYSARMFVPSTNLYMHSWVDQTDMHPELYWGRANGWATLSFCELLDVLPHEHAHYEQVLGLFKVHCQGLLKLQSRRGMWHQLLNRNDSYEESSCTAMFVYGLAHGIQEGWLDAKVFGPAALLGWNGLSEQINNNGQIENVCVGTGVSYEPGYYYYRHVHPFTAHGYGPVFMAGSEIIRLVEGFDIVQDTAIYFYDRK